MEGGEGLGWRGVEGGGGGEVHFVPGRFQEGSSEVARDAWDAKMLREGSGKSLVKNSGEGSRKVMGRLLGRIFDTTPASFLNMFPGRFLGRF